MKKLLRFKNALRLLICLFAMTGMQMNAQVAMLTTGSTTQNFDGLANSGTTNAWSTGVTIPNWYADRTGTGTTYTGDAGASTAGTLYSYGVAATTERALGSIGSSNATAGNFAYGVLLQNTSASAITDIKVAYTMEQWRNGGANAAQTLSFYYKISATAFPATKPTSPFDVALGNGWIAVSALNTSTPIFSTTAAALVGNSAANKVVVASTSIPTLSVPPGSYIMLKWEDPDHSGNDHGISIDDVTINWTVPPPPASEINVQGNSIDIAHNDITPEAGDHTNFGAVNVASGTVVRTFTIQNAASATANLTIGTISVTGAAFGDYTASAAGSTNLAPGASTTFTVTFDPSTGGARNATVNIDNNDGNEAPYLFAITGSGQADTAVMDYVNIQFPSTANITEGNTVTVYAQGYEPGITDSAGQGSNVLAWIGYSSSNTDPSGVDWTWLPATYNAGNSDPSNDEYSAVLGAGLMPGTYYYASRWQIGTGPYAYGDTGGVWNVPSQNGVLTVGADVVDFANLQFPAAATILVGGSETIYGRVYELGVTEAAGAGAGISAWIGYSATNTDPSTASWTWIPATFNVQAGSDDEYKAAIGSALPAGTYYYASRFKKAASNVYKYGGLGGFWSNDSGVLTVNTPQEINIQGNGNNIVDGSVTPSPTNDTSFGSVAAGSTIVKTFTIQNLGETNLVLDNPAVLLNETDAFSITLQPTSPVAPGGSTTFQVTFAPTAAGVDTNTVLVGNNDGDESVYSFDISGAATIVTPTATAATNITNNSFSANWNPAGGAASYRLDVATTSDFLALTPSNVVTWTFVPYSLTSDGGNANNTGANVRTLNTVGGTAAIITAGASPNIAASAMGWDSGSGTKYWQVSNINTTGMYDLTLSSDQQSSGTGPKDFKVQYKLGAGGTWLDVPGGAITIASSGSLTSLTDLALPAACANQSSVYIRWIMTSNLRFDQTTPGNTVASGGTSRMTHIFVKGKAGAFVPGYENLTVNGTTQSVTGLAEFTNYYYRVRSVGADSSVSPNSNTITVQTLHNPATFISVAQAPGIVCEGANATFNVTGLLNNITTAITFTIGAQQQTVNVNAGPMGTGTFVATLAFADNGNNLTVTTVERMDFPGDPRTVTVNNTALLSVNQNVTYYRDFDVDGFGDLNTTQVSCTGTAPAGFVSNSADCDDTQKLYSDLDNDTFGSDTLVACGGVANSDDCNDNLLTYLDADGDTFGSTTPAACGVTNSNDCNDGNNQAFPGHDEIGYNLIDDDCDGAVDEGFAPKATIMQGSQCNTILPTIDTQLVAYLVAGAQGYRWRVSTLDNSNNVLEVQELSTQLRVMKLTQLPHYAFNTKYKIEVAVYFAGFLQPFTPSECTVTTPSTTTSLSVCGQAMTSMTDVIYANIVPYATGYRFEITEAGVPTNTQEIDRPLRDFRLSLVTAFTVRFGKTYHVRVAARNTDGSYLPYGPTCNVSTPIFPTTSLQNTQCSNYAVPNNATQIYAYSFPGAISYVFNLSLTSPEAGVEVIRPLRAFTLNDFAGQPLIPGATYNVRVRLIFNGTDLAGPYGKTCTITLPGASKQIENAGVQFDAIAWPNPSTDDFNIEVTTAGEANVGIKVFDMMGRLLESRQAKVTGMETIKVGSQYPSGVYNVIVSQGEETKNLRVVKR
jgi:hypothetical protein